MEEEKRASTISYQSLIKSVALPHRKKNNLGEASSEVKADFIGRYRGRERRGYEMKKVMGSIKNTDIFKCGESPGTQPSIKVFYIY